MFAFFGNFVPGESDVVLHDLVVFFEGDVALDHVEEEDAEGPDG